MQSFQRNIYSYCLDLLDKFPIIAIIGARQVGKTTLAKLVGDGFTYVDLEKNSNYDKVSYDPEFFFKQYPKQVIFDEAQLLPALFTTLRGVVDEQRGMKGRFILTGSSSHELLTNISESLAGRVSIIELGTLKANEYFQRPLSDFYTLFQRKLDKKEIKITSSPLNLEQIQQVWLRGGYPEPIGSGNEFYQEWMVDYQSTYINRDIARLFPKLDKVAYRRFLTILGKLSNRLVNKSDIARALAVTEPTVSTYLAIAAGTFLWRQLPSYDKSPTKSIVKMPKGYIRDSGLLHHLLRIYSLDDLQSDPIAGFSFEAFVIDELLKGLQDARVRNVDAYYYRTRSGAEVDLVLEGTFGVLPIEIKYGSSVSRSKLRSLTDFIQANHCKYGMLINQSERIEWLTEDIIQIPVGYI